VSQATVPLKFVGKKVSELRLYDNYSVHYIGIKEGDTIISLDPDYVIQEEDKILLAGHNKSLEKITKL
jgi:Trk K+ transport system NAD-binding subunit